MKQKKITIVCLVLLLTFAGVLTASAKKFGGEHLRKNGGVLNMINQLDLSETQKNQVSEIVSSYKEKMVSSHETLRSVRQKLHNAMGQEPFDESAENELRLTFKEAALIKEDIFVMRTKMLGDIKAILTDEQKSRLSEMRAERVENMKSRRAQKRSMMNCWSDGQVP